MTKKWRLKEREECVGRKEEEPRLDGQILKKNLVAESEWKDNFGILRPYLTKRATNSRPNPSTVEAQLGNAIVLYQRRGRYRKVANAFGVSRGLVSSTVRKSSKTHRKIYGTGLD